MNYIDPLGLQGDFSGWGGGSTFGNASFENYVQNVGEEIAAQATQAATAAYEVGKTAYQFYDSVISVVGNAAQYGTPIIIYIKVPLGPKSADAKEPPSEDPCPK